MTLTKRCGGCAKRITGEAISFSSGTYLCKQCHARYHFTAGHSLFREPGRHHHYGASPVVEALGRLTAIIDAAFEIISS